MAGFFDRSRFNMFIKKIEYTKSYRDIEHNISQIAKDADLFNC